MPNILCVCAHGAQLMYDIKIRLGAFGVHCSLSVCVCVCVSVCVYSTCIYRNPIHNLTQGVLQTCSLGKLGPCREQTQQDSTTNRLLIYGGTAGLIRLANSGEQRERTRTHIHIPSNPTPTSFCTPLVACQIIAKAGKHDLLRRWRRGSDLSLFSCKALHLLVCHFFHGLQKTW